MPVSDCLERGGHALVKAGVVQLVLAIEQQEVLESTFKTLLMNFAMGRRTVEVTGVPQGTTNQHGCTIPNVAGDELMRQFWRADVSHSSIDRKAKVERRGDQRPIKVEDE